ncbi:MAG: hypothetical protein ACXVCP_10510 [Bdellovibrio sp.]
MKLPRIFFIFMLSLSLLKMNLANASAQSEALSLEEGIYDNSGFDEQCSLDITFDETTHEMLASYANPLNGICPGKGWTKIYKRIDDTRFESILNTEVLKLDVILKCTATPQDPTPCKKVFYGDNGKLIMQVNDEFVTKAEIKIINKNVFFQSGHIEIIRDKKLIKAIALSPAINPKFTFPYLYKLR